MDPPHGGRGKKGRGGFQLWRAGKRGGDNLVSYQISALGEGAEHSFSFTLLPIMVFAWFLFQAPGRRDIAGYTWLSANYFREPTVSVTFAWTRGQTMRLSRPCLPWIVRRWGDGHPILPGLFLGSIPGNELLLPLHTQRRCTYSDIYRHLHTTRIRTVTNYPYSPETPETTQNPSIIVSFANALARGSIVGIRISFTFAPPAMLISCVS